MTRRFVYIWLPYLTTDCFVYRNPGLNKKPFVLVTKDHGRMIITATSPQAEKNGIYKGMVLADARAIYPSILNFDDSQGLQTLLMTRIAEWCIRFTPRPAIDPLGGIILEVTGCTHLWGGEAAYIQDIISRLNLKGFQAKAAVADTIGAAWAITRFGKSIIVESGKHIDALMLLPPEALRLSADLIEKLKKLGLLQIRDLLTIPHSSLKRRFGSLIIQRLNQACGSEEEFIQAVCAAEPYHERLPCLEPISRIEGIEIALQKLLEQVCKRLQNDGKGLRTAHFKCYRIDNKRSEVEIHTNRPSNNTRHLFHLFGMKLSTIEPGPGIELFLLEATHIEEHIPPQEEIWKENGGIDDKQVAELIDRLSLRVGEGSIHRYLPDEHYWPERSYRKANSISECITTEWKTDRPRPIHLLSVPEIIEVTAPIPDYPPMLFRYKGQLHKIRHADGPERIEQEWWIQEGEHRDYYAVEDEEGSRYWMFRSGHYSEEKKPRWFLHGFFA